MKTFLLKITLFIIIISTVFLIPFFCFPNLIYNDSILAALPDKHKILAHSTSPKIIFIGDSNVSMGLNSEKISDAYHLPVINNSINIWLGLKFMIDDVKPYINKGDVIVLVGEYSCYGEGEEDNFQGYEALLAVLFNISPQEKGHIDGKQWFHLVKFVPHYVFSGLNYELFHRKKSALTAAHFRKEYNKYGDLYDHWSWPKVPFKSEEKCVGNEKLNPDVIPYLKKFQNYVSSKGATFVLLPPPIQDTSYKNQSFLIEKIQTELKKNDLGLISEPNSYEFADMYFNDNPYHLTKAGVDKRTDLVIKDLSKIVNKNSLNHVSSIGLK